MKALGVIFTALISAAAGAAAAVYTVKKREELEQYDYDFDDDDEIYFDDDDDCCEGCGFSEEEKSAETVKESADSDSDIEDLSKLDGADKVPESEDDDEF